MRIIQESSGKNLAEYQNPQQEPGGERKLMLVLILTFVGFIVFQAMMKKYAPQPPAAAKQTQTAPAQPAAATPAAPPSQASQGLEPPAAPVSVPAKQAAAESETVIENDLYRVTFSNRGAQVKSWILKKFQNDAQTGPLDIVNPAAAQKFGYPLSLWTYDATLTARINSALYVPSSEGTLSTPAAITFEYADQDILVRKSFHFENTYVLNVETSVIYKGAVTFAAPAWPSGFGDQSSAAPGATGRSRYGSATSPAAYAAGRIDYHSDASTDKTALIFPNYVLRLPVKGISSGKTIVGQAEWADAGDQYFTAAFVPNDPANSALITLRNGMAVPKEPGSNETTNVDVVGAAMGDLRGTTTERMFVGPKEMTALEAVNVPAIHNGDSDLRGTVDYGWWGIIARPLFIWLKWTHEHVVSNWGWAIVLQTLIITVVLLPFRIMQMKSMLKMQRIQPQIKAIQEKYKKYSMRDPRKAGMNEEVGALYKKEGVNPAGGCLPLLVTFPFIIAYYRMLGVALDLRQAPWLWIHDLSARDPFFVLPILMVVSMFAMQRMTPQTGMDPAQQRMMNWMMPLMMGFIFFNLQAGLNLYYAESNLISIAQQAIMNRTKLGQEMREMMAKRARKKEK